MPCPRLKMWGVFFVRERMFCVACLSPVPPWRRERGFRFPCRGREACDGGSSSRRVFGFA